MARRPSGSAALPLAPSGAHACSVFAKGALVAALLACGGEPPAPSDAQERVPETIATDPFVIEEKPQRIQAPEAPAARRVLPPGAPPIPTSVVLRPGTILPDVLRTKVAGGMG